MQTARERKHVLNGIVKRHTATIKARFPDHALPVWHPYDAEKNDGEGIVPFVTSSATPQVIEQYEKAVAKMSAALFANTQTWDEWCIVWRMFFANQIIIPVYLGLFYQLGATDNPWLTPETVKQFITLNSYGFITTNSQIGISKVVTNDFITKTYGVGARVYTVQREYVDGWAPRAIANRLVDEINRVSGMVAFYGRANLSLASQLRGDDGCLIKSPATTWSKLVPPHVQMTPPLNVGDPVWPGSSTDNNLSICSLFEPIASQTTRLYFKPEKLMSTALVVDIAALDIVNLVFCDTINGRNILISTLADVVQRVGRRVKFSDIVANTAVVDPFAAKMGVGVGVGVPK